MVVAELHVFPVKGLAGHAQPSALVEPWGLQHDRRWLVVDRNGRFQTQRVAPRMAVIESSVTAEGIRLSHPDHGAIDIAVPGADAARMMVTVWRNSFPAALASEAASDWIGAVLGQDFRLVHMHDTAARPISRTYALRDETVSFADGYPVLLTSLGSLADLNARLARPVPISRFRGNIVVEGAEGWAEDGWRVIRIGGAVFRVVKPCDRCIVTTIDQATGLRPDRTEPLRTLGVFRHDENGIMFGQNLIPSELGRIAVGDRVDVLESGPPNVVPIL
jgi:uncharacterized protein YcbX